jgi:hypothetical protein
MKKTLIVALMMVAGIAQAACEGEQRIVDNPKGLSESSRAVWAKQLASCLENAKDRAIADEKYAAEAKIRAEEQRQKEAKLEEKWNSFKEPKIDSPTYYRDKYAQEVGRNKLFEEEFGEQCIGRFSKEVDKWCLMLLRKSNYTYLDERILAGTKRMADEEPAWVESRIAYAAEEKKRQAEVDRLAKLPGVRIGMTANQVINQTSWGRPSSVNRTTTSAGTREQWVYGSRNYLYFTNSILTAIQN